MSNNEIPYSKVSSYGPGGRLCNCCGPSPKNRKKHDRSVKRSSKFNGKKEIVSELSEVYC